MTTHTHTHGSLARSSSLQFGTSPFTGRKSFGIIARTGCRVHGWFSATAHVMWDWTFHKNILLYPQKVAKQCQKWVSFPKVGVFTHIWALHGIIIMIIMYIFPNMVFFLESFHTVDRHDKDRLAAVMWIATLRITWVQKEGRNFDTDSTLFTFLSALFAQIE